MQTSGTWSQPQTHISKTKTNEHKLVKLLPVNNQHTVAQELWMVAQLPRMEAPLHGARLRNQRDVVLLLWDL